MNNPEDKLPDRLLYEKDNDATEYCGDAISIPKKKYVFKNNKEYFNEYYRAHNHEMKCICGQSIKSMNLRKHIKSKKHIFLMTSPKENI